MFRDPRRFGGLWTFASFEQLRAKRWAALGADALRIKPLALWQRLQKTRRPIKAALLDQNLIAGMGNIYVDESLFAARILPDRTAHTLSQAEVRRLVMSMRRLLKQAIEAGGSTLRDYIDGTGQRGGYQARHRVYGRGGRPCRRCRTTLHTEVLAGRTTVYCMRCQHESSTLRS